MPNEINVRQNAEDNLERLAAQRSLYSKAKLVRLVVVVSAIGIAVGSTVAALYFAKASPGFGLAGLLLALIEILFLDGLEESYRQKAAAMQEDFDTRVFGLVWNDSLGQRPPHELVVEEGASGKIDPKLRDWYPDVKALPGGLAALVCQRSCMMWDGRTRSVYALVVGIVTFAFAVAMVALAIATEMKVSEFLAALAFPALPAIMHGVKIVRAHRKAKGEEERILEEIESLRARGPSGINSEAIRKVQDRLWLLRREQPPVPDTVYWWRRDHLDKVMRAATARLIGDMGTGSPGT